MEVKIMQSESIYKSPEGEQAIRELYDRGLEHWPVPWKPINLDTSCGRTFAVAWGKETAPPMVLLHGSGGNALAWMPDAVHYEKHFRVYAVDIPGEPGKSVQIRPEWTSPFYAEWLDEVLDALGIDKVILGGISLGGWTALKYALYKPERVEKLCLVCPGGIYPARFSFVLRSILYLLAGKRGQDRMKRYVFNNRPVPEGLALYMDLMAKHYRYRVGSPPVFTDVELRKITMPLFFLAGAEDVAFHSHKAGKRLERLLPHAVVKILPGEGHVLLNTGAGIMEFLTDGK